MTTSHYLLIAAALAVAAFVVIPRLNTTGGSEARKLVADGALLVDVRTPEEYAAGHLDGAINIPVQVLEERVGELGDNKERPIVLYCRSGARSSSALDQLKAKGFTSLHNLGPMSAW